MSLVGTRPPTVDEWEQYELHHSDALITDYSSSMWDYSLTGKPCFLYVPDLHRCKQHYLSWQPVSDLDSVVELNS